MQTVRLPPLQHRLLSAAIRAPSGDNSQPWSFKFEGLERLLIYAEWERSTSLFDFQNTGTYLSVGAVIENIRIQAAHEGLDTEVTYPKAGSDLDPLVALRFCPSPDLSVTAATVKAMLTRTVTRRPFVPWPPAFHKMERILADAVSGPGVRVFRRRNDIARWARLVVLGDLVRFTHPVLHEDVMSRILLTKESAERMRVGLEIDRLGLGPLAASLIRFLRPWDRVEHLIRWGIHRVFAEQSRALILSSGALLLVTVPDQSPEDWIRAGEQVERMWIRAHEQGLCVHPITIALYLDLRYQHEGVQRFLPEHEPLLQEIRKTLAELIPDGTGAMLFRLGYGWRMSHPAIRLPVEQFVRPSTTG